jgi:hypothetical protein
MCVPAGFSAALQAEPPPVLTWGDGDGSLSDHNTAVVNSCSNEVLKHEVLGEVVDIEVSMC